jgi:hypothetical protein
MASHGATDRDRDEMSRNLDRLVALFQSCRA